MSTVRRLLSTVRRSLSTVRHRMAQRRQTAPRGPAGAWRRRCVRHFGLLPRRVCLSPRSGRSTTAGAGGAAGADGVGAGKLTR